MVRLNGNNWAPECQILLQFGNRVYVIYTRPRRAGFVIKTATGSRNKRHWPTFWVSFPGYISVASRQVGLYQIWFVDRKFCPQNAPKRSKIFIDQIQDGLRRQYWKWLNRNNSAAGCSTFLKFGTKFRCGFSDLASWSKTKNDWRNGLPQPSSTLCVDCVPKTSLVIETETKSRNKPRPQINIFAKFGLCIYSVPTFKWLKSTFDRIQDSGQQQYWK